MQTFAIDGAAADAGGSDSDGPTRHAVAEALGTTDFVLNRYHLPPGTGLPSGLHTHLDQEEVFVVLDGEVTFQTLSDPVVLGADEAVRFVPGEYQTGENESHETAVVLAIGAPKESEAVRVPLSCPDCGARGLSPEYDGGEVLLGCPDCGREHRTHGCPECGRSEMQAASGDAAGEVIVVCPDCGAERSEPRWTE